MNNKKKLAFLARAKGAQKKQLKRKYDNTPYFTVEEFIAEESDDGIFEDAIFNGFGGTKAFFLVNTSEGLRKVSGLKSVAKNFDENEDKTYTLILEILEANEQYSIDLLVVNYAEESA